MASQKRHFKWPICYHSILVALRDGNAGRSDVEIVKVLQQSRKDLALIQCFTGSKMMHCRLPHTTLAMRQLWAHSVRVVRVRRECNCVGPAAVAAD